MNRLPRVETLLVLACAAGAAFLAGSQFTTIFELTPPGGEALSEIDADDQHGYATLVLAIFALVMLVIGIAAKTESMAQIAAFAVAASGAVALLIFLIVDLPDANSIGTLDDARESFVDAEAKPVAGFWFELVGSLILAICGGSLATLGPESFAIGTRGAGSASDAGSGNGTTPQPQDSRKATVGAGLRRRPRAGREAGGAIGAEDEAAEVEGGDAAREKGEAPGKRGGINLPSLPKVSLPRPSLPKNPFGGGKRKRIGQQRPEKDPSGDGEGEEPGEGESFNWPSRPGRND